MTCRTDRYSRGTAEVRESLQSEAVVGVAFGDRLTNRYRATWSSTSEDSNPRLVSERVIAVQSQLELVIGLVTRGQPSKFGSSELEDSHRVRAYVYVSLTHILTYSTEALLSEFFSRLKDELTALQDGVAIEVVTTVSRETWTCTPQLKNGIIDFGALKTLYGLGSRSKAVTCASFPEKGSDPYQKPADFILRQAVAWMLRQNVLPKSGECAAQLPQCAAQLPQCAAHLRQCAAELRDYLLPPKSCPRDIHVHPRAEMTKVLLARQVVPPTFAIVGPCPGD
ncbi:unnamed protein product [Heligmosomoides polygyrus]|uniref:Uncharacterized protein n=1 Tax=Heligmosomoides polygyrus TaxID=6339 RepID=A0A183G5H6_HELPZ|nr:unnamed protein product [Heligmosomoides polygyrus]